MAELVNSNLVNVVENDIPAYLNWYDDRTTTLNTIASGVYFNPDMSYTFANSNNMNLGMSDEWLGYFAFVTNMSHMAYNCTNLRGKPVCPSKVVDMNCAFFNCQNIDRANVGVNVQDYNKAYYNCINVRQIDIGVRDASNFYHTAFGQGSYVTPTTMANVTNLSRVNKIVVGKDCTGMHRAFYNARTLGCEPACGNNTVDFFSAYSYSNVCGKPVIGNNVVNAVSCYHSCNNLSGDVYSGKNCENMHAAFCNASNSKLGNVNIGNYVTDISLSFQNCTNLTGDITIGRNVVNMSNAFYGDYNIHGYLNGDRPVNTLNNMVNAFFECRNMGGSPLKAHGSINNMYQAYFNCYTLKGTVDFTVGTYANNMWRAFYNCQNLERSELSSSKLSRMNNMGQSFRQCRNMKGVGAIGSGTKYAHAAYYNDYSLESFNVPTDMGTWINIGNLNVNLSYAFAECRNSVGPAVIPGMALSGYNGFNDVTIWNMYYMYYHCNGIQKIELHKENSYKIANTIFGDADNTNLSNVKQIYIAYHSVRNLNHAFGTHKTLRGYLNHPNDNHYWGYTNPIVEDMRDCFWDCWNLTGDGYVYPSVKYMNWAYQNCLNINGDGYVPQNLAGSLQYKGAFLRCNNLTGLRFNYKDGSLAITRAFTNWLNDNNGSNGHIVSNLAKMNNIWIGPGVTNMYSFMDNDQCHGSTMASTFAGRVNTNMQNVINAGYAFRRVNNYAMNSTNRTGTCPPRATFTRCMYENCKWLQNAECSDTVQNAGYMFSQCWNINSNIGNQGLGRGLKDCHLMYYNCRNLSGNIPEWFGECNVANSYNMFAHCYNLNNEGNLIVPTGVSNYYNMYYDLHNRNFRQIHIYGAAPSTCVTWSIFGSNESLVRCAVRNIKVARFMNTFDAVPHGASYSGISKEFRFDWYEGLTDLYINTRTAARWFPSDTSVWSDGNWTYWRSCGHVNLRNIYIGNCVTNLAYFARWVNKLNIDRCEIAPDAPITNMEETFSECHNIRRMNGFNIPATVNNLFAVFYNCSNLEMNLSNTDQINYMGCDDVAVNTDRAFFNDLKLTGNAFDFVKSNNMYRTYYLCPNITGNGYVGDNVANAWQAFGGCSNLDGYARVGSNVTAAGGTFKGCTNLKYLTQLSSKNCNYEQTFNNCWNMNFTLQDYNLEKEFLASVGWAQGMFYNCGNMHGTAVIKNNWGTWWNVYYNCQNITGWNVYSIPNGQSIAGVFNVLFGRSVMNANNITEINFCGDPLGGGNGASVQSGLLWHMHNIHNINVNRPNAFHLLHWGGSDQTYNKSAIADRVANYWTVNNFNSVEKIYIGSQVINAAGLMANLQTGTSNMVIDLNDAVNLKDMEDMFVYSKNYICHANIHENVTTASCAFERGNVHTCDIAQVKNPINMRYTFTGCPLETHVYVPYNTHNTYYMCADSTVPEITIRPIANCMYELRNCTNLKKLHIEPSYAYKGYTSGVWGTSFGSNGSLENLEELTISNNLTGCPDLFARCKSFKLSPVLPYNATNMYCAYYCCDNMNGNLGEAHTNAQNIRYIFGGTSAPVYGNLYLHRNVSSGCDYGGILNKDRLATDNLLNIFWKKDSHWDNAAKTEATVGGLPWGCNDQGSIINRFVCTVADNGWYCASRNIRIYNNFVD